MNIPGYTYEGSQKHELNIELQYMMKHHVDEYNDYLSRKNGINNEFEKILTRWDQGHRMTSECYSIFARHIIGKSSLDIGCGCYPYSMDALNVSVRYAIDPLADVYRQFQRIIAGGSFFDDFIIYNQPAETKIEDLKITGYILSRNMLDHAEDPLAILDNISEYAHSGCYLLLWTDIWHIAPTSSAHRSITRSVSGMDKTLKGCGFRKISAHPLIRNPKDAIEYGGVFIKE
jgi:2-polyprenyl-3-methyl-5-hydroxy-6-metoxy-1,4-benzoquinol methylase